jgi:hypothetical protein
MLDRLLHDTAHQLHDEQLARRTAKQLVDAPAGLRATLIATLDESRDKPEAKNAAAQAIEASPEETVLVLTQRELAVRNTIHALVEEIQHDDKARHAFIVALDENRDLAAAVLAQHPDVMGRLFKAIAKRGVDRGQNELQAFLRSLGD